MEGERTLLWTGKTRDVGRATTPDVDPLGWIPTFIGYDRLSIAFAMIGHLAYTLPFSTSRQTIRSRPGTAPRTNIRTALRVHRRLFAQKNDTEKKAPVLSHSAKRVGRRLTCGSEETEEEMVQRLQALKESSSSTPAMGFWEVDMECIRQVAQSVLVF